MLLFSGSAGVSYVNCSRVSIGNVTVDYDPAPTKTYSSITYSLINSTNVLSQDLTIASAPYMAITAFTGGGNHTFRGLRFAPPRGGAKWTFQRDAIRMSDLRFGPIIEDRSVGFCGDDFLNIKNTLMLLVSCETSSSCVAINPHVPGEQPIPFGGTSVLKTARAGNRMSFFEWPNSTIIMPQLGGAATVESLVPVLAMPTLAVDASALERSLAGVWP